MSRMNRRTGTGVLCLLVCLGMLLSLCCGAALAEDVLTGDGAYISEMKINETRTGTAPFDADDAAGNDSSESNKIIRSFDTATYALYLEMEAYNDDGAAGKQYREARMCFAFELPFSSDEAVFDTSSMAWMDNDPDSPYKFRVVEENGKQILYCSLLKSEQGGYVVPGTQEVLVGVYVKNARNGTVVQPTYYAWMAGNEVHEADWTEADGPYAKIDFDAAACAAHRNAELRSVQADPITVSAKLKMNVHLTDVSHFARETADFNVGNAADAPTPAANLGLGTITGGNVGIGIGIALYNDSPDKGMRGIAYPDGSPLSFDVLLDLRYELSGGGANPPLTGTAGGKAYDFSPLLYSYGGVTKGHKNDDGRTVVAATGLPNNKASASEQQVYECYNGGTWKAVQDGNTIHVTVSNYEINGVFPITSSNSDFTRVYSENIGYISTCEMYFLLPYYNRKGTDGKAEDYIAAVLGSGEYELTIREGNLSCDDEDLAKPDTTKATPDNQNQMVTNDDSRSKSLALSLPGSYSKVCTYVTRGGHNDSSSPLTVDCYYDGRDWAYPGTKLSIIAGLSYADSRGEKGNQIAAFDDFLKIDADAIMLCDEYIGDTHPNYKGRKINSSQKGTDGISDYVISQLDVNDTDKSIHLLYAVKTDGENWASDDEMRAARQEDANLLWFDTLPAAEAQGKVVGVLIQYRGEIAVGNKWPRVALYGAVREDAEPGKTYMITDTLRIWNNYSLDAINVKQNTPDAQIPVRKTASDTGYADQLDVYEAGATRTMYTPYTKLTYNEDGSTSGDNPQPPYYGDTLYVTLYQTQVGIRAINSGSVNEDGHAVYNMDAGQSIADFRVTPMLVLDTLRSNETDEVPVIDVTMTQTLPRGLTYIEGSSYWGGSYQQTGPGRMGAVAADESGVCLRLRNGAPQKYTYTTSDGREYPITVTLTATQNADGTTQLKYVFEDVPLLKSANGESVFCHDMYFSAQIESGTSTTWQLVEPVQIAGSTEHTKISNVNGNLAEEAIVVYQSTSEGVGEVADNLYNEQDAMLGWVITYHNSANNARSNALLFSRLPQGDHHGTYTLESWSLDLAALGTEGADLTLWYTTQDMSGKDASSYTAADLAQAGWQTLALQKQDNTLTPQNIDAAKNATAWILTGMLPGGRSFTVHQQIKPQGNQPQDSYLNIASFRTLADKALMSYATVYVVGRELTGLVWYDQNRDGARGEDEALVPGVTVELYRRTQAGGLEKVTQDVTGAQLGSVRTDANGAYAFAKLAQGDYVVSFSGADGYDGATAYQADGVEETHNSDAQAAGEAYQTAPDIRFSAADQIVGNLERREHQDLGLIRLGDLKIRKAVTGDVPAADAEKAFAFAVKLTVAGAAYTQPVAYAIDEEDAEQPLTPDGSGTVTFTLKKDQNITLKGLPQGTAYEVSETQPGAGYTPSIDQPTGTVGAEAVQVTCTNAYTPDNTAYTPQAVKRLEGMTPPSTETFSFALALTGGDVTGMSLPQSMTASVQGEGTAAFGEITFTKAGVYTFSISEANGQSAGYTYDTRSYTLTVTVTDNGGSLSAAAAYTLNGTDVQAAEFVNTYNAAPTAYAPQVIKQIEGETPSQAQTFTFTIEAAADNPEGASLPEQTEITVSGEGSASFGEIAFTKPGTYGFTLAETDGEAAGYIYDGVTWTLTVQVADEGGALKLSGVSYERQTGETSQEAATFTNRFSVTSVNYVPQAEKQITGSPMGSQKASFVIAPRPGNPEGGAVLAEGDTAEIDGAGTVVFPRVTFVRAGEYSFAITEARGANPQCDYDESVWTLTVTVTETDSVLSVAQAVYTKDGQAGSPVFINHYRDGSLKLSKKVQGDLGDQSTKFTFIITLTDADGRALTGRYPITGAKTGDYAGGEEIKLKHGQSVTISGLPEGARYSVEEREANQDGYLTTALNASGKISGAETASVTFVNERYGGVPLPETGDDSAPVLWLSLTAIAGALMLALRRRQSMR